ncbi:hypothetical protein [Absidia glauca]|uniref:ENTH domain-containing protein n=1 Tax=Absidia glauca TaxID=4829 RepID=A0A163K518_ABSGL|nr:hypothetical protein [Absidia glauca]
MTGKGVVRSLSTSPLCDRKNFTKGFSSVQIKVREATSNDAWGPSGTLMNEIAQLTYNQHDFTEVMDMIDKRLNDKGKNWRHVFKALLLLDYCLHVGSENVVLYAKENSYVVKTLKEFQHVEENGKDVGANVRQKAKDIANLLQDDNRLREERRQRHKMRDRMAGVGDYMGEVAMQDGGGGAASRMNGQSTMEDDLEMEKALEESKRQAAEEERKRRQGEDEDLAMALKLSEQEAKEKQQSTDQATGAPNFDMLFNPYHQPQQQQQSHQQIAWGQGVGGLADGGSNSNFGNSIPGSNHHEPVNNPYLQQQQQIQYPQQINTSSFFDNTQQQHQPATSNPLHDHHQVQYGLSAFPSNIHQPHSALNGPPSQPTIPAGSKNPFSKALSQGGQPSSEVFGQHQLDSQAHPSGDISGFEQRSMSSTSVYPFNSSTLTTPSSPSFATTTAGQADPLTVKGNKDPRYQQLNSLLGSRDDGMDTFGNTGSLRVPFGTGFATCIKPQENGHSDHAINSAAGGTGTKAGQGVDGSFPLASPMASTESHQLQHQYQQPHSTSRNPFGGVSGVNGPSFTPTTSDAQSQFN